MIVPNVTVLLAYLLTLTAWAALSTATPGSVVAADVNTGGGLPAPTPLVELRYDRGKLHSNHNYFDTSPERDVPRPVDVRADEDDGDDVLVERVPGTAAATTTTTQPRKRRSWWSLGSLFRPRISPGKRYNFADTNPDSVWHCEETNETTGIPLHSDCVAICDSLWATRATQRTLPASGWITWQVGSCNYILSNLNFCKDIPIVDGDVYTSCRNLTSTCNNSFNRDGYLHYDNHTNIRLQGHKQTEKDFPELC